jgi:tetratricopeptide (TPR) repeat protein
VAQGVGGSIPLAHPTSGWSDGIDQSVPVVGKVNISHLMRLRRMRTYFIPLILLVVISTSCSKSPEDQAVAELIEEASRLVGEAALLREENPDEADRLESEAIASLEEAIFNYPSSSIVAELYNGEISVGPYTIHALEDRVAARMEIEGYVAGGKEKEEVELDPITRAENLAKKPGPPYLKAIVLVRLAEKYREAGDSRKVSELLALALLSSGVIEEDYFRSRAMAIVSEQYILIGEGNRALEILNDAEELAKGIKYPYFQSGALAEIIRCSVKAGKYEEALQLLEIMKDPYFQADSLVEISGHYIDTDNRDEALVLLTRAEEISGEIDITHFRAEVLAEIALRYTGVGKGDKASELLARALELVETVDDLVSRSEALVIIGRGYVVMSESERAVEVFSLANERADAIENNLFKDQILQKIAEEYIAMGEYERASGIEDTIEDARSKALVLASLAESYNSSGDKEQSQSFMNRTLEAIKEIKNPLFKAAALIKISHLYQPPDPPTVDVMEEGQSPAPELSRSPSE